MTLVWIDSQEALIVRWDGQARIDRVRSEVPPHHHSTGHLRIDPAVRHGGGGAVETGIERDRQEHLRVFLHQVADRIPPEEDVRIVGPGPVRDHLRRLVREDDRRHHRTRSVGSGRAAPLTERQLVARVRALAGEPANRTDGGSETPAGSRNFRPR